MRDVFVLRKPVAAVRVSNFENGVRHALSFRYNQLEPRGLIRRVPSGQYRHRIDGAVFGESLARPRPDFELRVTPASINLRAGMTAPVTVHVLRREGFDGEVNLHIADAPIGKELGGGVIPAGVDSTRVTLTAPPMQTVIPHQFLLEGEAEIDGHKVRHTGVPADDWMQAFTWHHLVCAQEGLVMVSGNPRRNSLWLTDMPRIKIPVGGTTKLRIDLPYAQLANYMKLVLNEPPDGISLLDITQANGALALRLRVDSKLKPGLEGNLIVDVSMIRPTALADSRPRANRYERIDLSRCSVGVESWTEAEEDRHSHRGRSIDRF